ncbi:facilitated trehalose transporter Tret1-like isoform X3 [Agrilus planipennis]|uniref:Facilitated trehalose transporter Tret1-like isoform X3 n=1 Tax=Agrilus planipennis TaxID=224129 RepID=A0A1W4XKU0_AGRPL|nr:facilitated trehalose transporter Tret1-like isoform X3 [Agrilus planipennis]
MLPAKTKGRRLKKGNLGSFASGILLTWTSPVLPKLNNATNVDSNPLGEPINLIQESWIGSCLALGAIFGPLLAGFTADRIGRKNTLVYCAGLPFLISLLILAFAKTPFLYYVARFLGGFGIGNLYTALPMYFGEISEASIRGAVSSSMNVFICLGELYAYAVGPYVSIMLFCLSCAVFPLAFILTFFFFPDSPYYLLAKDKMRTAEKSLMRLRNRTKSGIQQELKMMQRNVEEEAVNRGSLRDIFKSKGLRKALLICLGLVSFQQFSGITVVQFYVTNIFEATGSSLSPDVSAIIVGIVQLLASFSTPILVDRLGRKLLFLMSAIGMVISEVPLGIYFYLKDGGTDVSTLGWLPVLSLVAYIITYNLGFGPLPWTVMGEVFPSNVKSTASMITASVCWALGFLVANLFPIIAEAMGKGGTFWLFSGFCVLAAIFTALFLVETKGKSLQEIQKELNK